MKRVVLGIIRRTNEKDQDEYFLVSSEREHFGEYSGAYYPPGGHTEGNETDQEALGRELKEELGVSLKPIEKISDSGSDIADQTTGWWLCQYNGEKFTVDSSELANHGWFTKEQLLDLRLWPATREFFEAYFNS